MRLPVRAAAFLAATLTTASTLTVLPASADPLPLGLAAEITSPVEPMVLGQQPVVVHVTADSGLTARSATVTIASTADPTRTRIATGAVPATCQPECDVTVTVDTVSWIDPGLDPAASDTSLPDGYATMQATVEAVSDAGDVVRAVSTTQYTQVANARPQLWPGVDNQYTSTPVVGADPIAVVAYATPYSTGIDRLDVTLFGPDVRWSGSFAGTPLDGNHQSRITGSIPTTGLTSGHYTLRFVAFDDAGKPSDVIARNVVYYAGPSVSVDRLVAQTPTQANGWKGGVAELTVSVGPDWSPFEPKRVDVYLDGDALAGTVKTFPRSDYCPVDPDGNPACPSTITVKVPVSTPVPPEGIWDSNAPLPAGGHTVRAVYTEATSWPDRLGASRTATASATTTIATAGVTASTSVAGPVVQNASGTLAFTLTSREGAGTSAPMIRSWTAGATGGPVIASGSCPGSSCLMLTGAVPLKGLAGSYPGLVPNFHVVPVTLTFTDSNGVTGSTTVRVGVDPAVRASADVVATGSAGATAYATLSVQQLDNEMLPGVPVALQARTAGSSTWRTVLSTKTTSTGSARVPVAVAYNTYWRTVVGARPGWNGAATSAQIYTKVAARVTASGLPLTGVAGRSYTARATLYPATAGRLVSVQVRASGAATWRTVARPATNALGQVAAGVKFTRGSWLVRVVADTTTASTSGTSKSLSIKVP